MISVKVLGSFNQVESLLKKLAKLNVAAIMNASGQEGVSALANATPTDTGVAAHSWSYKVSSSGGVYVITWTNSDIENGFPVVIMLQYGHGTGTGGYVAGIDFINPAMKPVFDRIASNVWKAVTSA